ncbi:orotate phosphoribosyltransferase [Marinicella gelatinilytica]|uniref:orotate phosphoribosyltransferase n=1 Tax=Marinicella gelatinilytica TaxID=2996017 RepID=UPI002260B947|nr:orotate phosphoribosyltransferase [Marinicella gelatinilytica]MCX7544766.1 orotate phosphoribosyltransferase [Marinicella gelatinilytica]
MSIAQQFLQLALEKNVLKLGEFTLKSGRVSPYFFNAGLFDDGRSLQLLGDYFAQTIVASGIEFDGLFGPAYKGIPLATSIAVAYQQRYQRNIPVTFNRKEVKDHGEGGQLMGAPLQGRILIVDDVVSAGTSVRQSIDLINQSGARPVAVAVALDRQEKGVDDISAMQELQQNHGLQTTAIACLDDLMAMLPDDSDEAGRVAAYRRRYGCQQNG